jgi:S1-C subfamily serine protease
LRAVDNVGGLALGAATGLALCWAVGAVLLYVPGQTELRRHAQESAILSTLNREIPPDEVMGALARIDALGAIAGPVADVPSPDTALLRDPDVTVARESVVRVRGNACGLGVEGSGWVAAQELVVTNAHVVAGVDRPVVDFGRGAALGGQVVAFDARNDIAVVAVPGLRALVLERAPARSGAAGALLGYPENGPYTATAVRLGKTVSLVGRDAYGRFPVVRPVTALRGRVRQGNSGGPVVDEQGRVMATVFGGRTGGEAGGYAVPNEHVRKALATAARGEAVSSACVSR